MEILQIVSFGLVATILIIILKEQKPQIAFLLSIITGVSIFIFLLGKIAVIIQTIEKLAFQANIDIVFLETILKIIGIAYIAEFGAQISRDAGEGTVANKIELAGKILIMVLALPIIAVIIETVIQLLP
ncbi:stage III sporulation protein AD [Desulfuribacillus stibiiarsenatis]|uniref:Stage III sporulation protein AD n=1 Tax=Desulfuribacillus stibiiarsenatis TaxID=1390249 RepID=A0A1E5L670_9FIRM|nr:stage III sporulation protein AD [Desulfuribacillus stibiiarsenatis]OEH85652.1 stage III sporulation protein AD [Desulfuribacillus stibiiarsenatis]